MVQKNNIRLTREFNKYYPCGHSNYRVLQDPNRIHVFQSRAKGSKFWDVDGNEYIDYLGGFGPNILGHCHPEYIASLKTYMETKPLCIGSSAIDSEDDILVAEKLVKHIPCAEKIKFNVTGSEAVQQAFRLARAYTGRSLILRFGGHYHGWLDNICGGVVDPSPRGKPFPLLGSGNDHCETDGRFPGAIEQGLMIPWNDIDALERTLEKYADKVAIIHLEALVGNAGLLYPRPGYLERIRDLSDQYGIVLSFDEVITGFRVGLHGAQGLFGVTPDIATFGKALGAGVPISAVVGKASVMDVLKEGRVLGPGTFNGNPFCMHAVKTTLQILERDDGAAYRTIDRVQQKLTDGLSEISQRRGITMRIQKATSMFMTLFGVSPDKEQYTQADSSSLDIEYSQKFFKSMVDKGIYVSGRWYSTLSHCDADTEKTLECADKVMSCL